ncbi:hypothetical protein [Endozoicomonas sp. 8E]|uniref:hypothetical protein n=1 Tax=Endozoicomonas sp. 8E TaxID=3035692 RepID=UPI002938DB3E|nr:hypothetical protein [Endozoicomonas sp. 8E]WOG30063.1 hypothetical protein P6910_10530 [Endozoicomonas sp. 8E]
MIKQIPDNTVILLSSKTTSPTVAPVTGKPTVEYLIANAITLKNGQDIIGAADDGYEIVIKLHPGFSDRNMIEVGVEYNGGFNFSEAIDNHIKHITFRPTGTDPDRPIYNIFYTNCYNRTLAIENNVLYLPTLAAVDMRCATPLDASANNLQTGPGLRFANNVVIGETIRTTQHSMIPLAAIIINFGYITRQSNKLKIIENIVRGKTSQLAEIHLASESSIDIFRNTVTIDTEGVTRDEIASGIPDRRGGFALIGDRFGGKVPRYKLAGNYIYVTTKDINISFSIELALACNDFLGTALWNQYSEYYAVIAVNSLRLGTECQRSVSSTAGMTTRRPTLNQIMNTWTPINYSRASVLSGLTNIQGQLYFDNAANCPTVAAPAVVNTTSAGLDDSDVVTTSTAGLTATTTALGVITTFITTLAVMLNL